MLVGCDSTKEQVNRHGDLEGCAVIFQDIKGTWGNRRWSEGSDYCKRQADSLNSRLRKEYGNQGAGELTSPANKVTSMLEKGLRLCIWIGDGGWCH
eukprot:c34378_g1_i1 orf=608-895(-)